MKILALDSSGLVASVALLENDNLVAEFTVNNKKTHSQTLLPMLDEVVNAAGIELDAVDAIAIAAGPGSFTGLRIGAATVKGLSLALDKPVVPVPTLEGLAYNFWGSDRLICPIMDARRNQVYTGLYHCRRSLEIVMEQCAMDMMDLIRKLNDMGERVIFLGDGVPVYREMAEKNLTVEYDFAPASNNRQRAASVASLGMEYFRQGKTVTAEEFEPDYLRKSQAEREREEAEAAKADKVQADAASEGRA